MPPPPSARLRDARAVAALGLAAGITVPAALLGGPQAAALPSRPAPSLAGAAGVAGTAGTAEAGVSAVAADEQPGCGNPDAEEFPIEARIQDAPDRYASGGGHGTWFLDLTNTTAATCRALHPVLVLTDRDRRLTSEQIRVEFAEPGRAGATHRVTWESTDHDEQIGVFGGDDAPQGEGDGDEGDGGSGEPFLGFTVPAGKTVSVRVRMAFTSDTAPGPVTAHAAVVQRRHQNKAKGGGREDGDWVGESGEYPFVIADGVTGGIREPEAPRTERPARPDTPPRQSSRPESPSPQRSGRPDPERSGPGADTPPERPGDPDNPGTDPGTGQAPSPDPDPSSRPSTGIEAGGRDPSGGDGTDEHPGHPPRDGSGSPLPELARTGPASAARTGAVAGALLLGGAGLVLHARRARRAVS
ncbi:peptidase [Streptomyces sp. NPDC087897]|uniref:peptidase n=1 Tax=Streptomyces sp. NPDC087897 TaxID=3365817 RepID=UPI0037FFCB40